MQTLKVDSNQYTLKSEESIDSKASLSRSNIDISNIFETDRNKKKSYKFKKIKNLEQL